MPELPEVETTRRGLLPHLTQHTLTGTEVRQPRLRYPVDINALTSLIDTPLLAIGRRAKYLLLHFEAASLIIHLGMSGSLRITRPEDDWRKHDHWQLTFGQQALRYHDPRRFGFLLHTPDAAHHPLLTSLGPEPLSNAFTPEYLSRALARRRTPIKTRLMDSKVVVGIGNIYACEALFTAGIHPLRPAGSLNSTEIQKLHHAIVQILSRAIRQGGSTLRDFLRPDGQPGYFAQTLSVYGREGQPCPRCQHPVDNLKLGGRSSFYCPHCQPLA